MFDRKPADLPIATVRSRTWSRAAAASRLRGALAARWQWLRPRTLPVIVAAIGACALLAATNYLTKLARETPVADQAMTLRIDTAPAAGITVTAIQPQR